MAENISGVTLRLLGSVEITVEGRVVDLAPKPRTLVALLAAHLGSWVRTEMLVDELWGGRLFSSAEKTLQGNILRVRRALGPDTVLSRRGSYRLNEAVVVLDVERFEAIVGQVEVLWTGAHDAAALNTVEELARSGEILWTGEPYGNVGEADVFDRSRARLAELHVRLRQTRLGAQIELGQSRAVIVELEGILATDPLREDVWALYIRALQQLDRRGDALAAFGRARRSLTTELGIEPGPALRALERAILADEQIDHAPGVPAVALSPVRRREPFVGRSEELSLARELLEACRGGAQRTLLVQGSAGIGKTGLVQEVVSEAASFGAVVVSGRNDSSLQRSYGAIIGILEQVELLVGQVSVGDNDALRRIARVRSGVDGRPREFASYEPSSKPLLERRLTPRRCAS